MSYAGERLVEELGASDITVDYVIDQNVSSNDCKTYKMNEELPCVDAIIVTAITYFDEIESALSEKVDCPIISLEDIIYEL